MSEKVNEANVIFISLFRQTTPVDKLLSCSPERVSMSTFDSNTIYKKTRQQFCFRRPTEDFSFFEALAIYNYIVF